MAVWDIEDLFVRHGKDLTRVLRRGGACPETAADLTQETFLRLLTAVPQGPIENVRAYMLSIARNLSIDLARRQRLLPRVKDSAAALEGLVDEQPSPERALLSRQELAIVQAALGRISQGSREVFLARVEGKTFDEIGRLLGIPTKTAFSRMVSVLMHLKAALDRARGEAPSASEISPR
jgi:RNA polymerase sigma factor (sigma-70 family)